MGFQNDARFLNVLPGLSPYTNPLMASIAQGQKMQKDQKAAAAADAAARERADSLAAEQLRQNAEMTRRANAKKPDVSQILADAAKPSAASTTLLNGPAGVDPGSVRLGTASRLGA